MQIGILLLILLGWMIGTMAAEVPAVAQNKAPVIPQPAEKTISGDELTNTAMAAVNRSMEGKVGIEAKVEIVHLPPPLKVTGDYTLVAESLGNIVQPGVRTVQIQVQRGNRIIASTSVNVRVRLYQNLPVAAGAAQANETMSAADVEYQVREVKPNMGRCINPNELLSMRLKVPVTAGQVLEERLFQPLPVIRKGDRVLVVLKRGALTISTNAEAQGEACIGQNVRVKFLDSNAELYVKASGPGQADM